MPSDPRRAERLTGLVLSVLPERLSDNAYLGLGGVTFLFACFIHWLGWRLILAGTLRSAEVAVRRAGLLRWLAFVAVVELVALAFLGGWYLLFRGTRGLAWVAPPIGFLVGAAAPLQLAVAAVSRAARSADRPL